MKRYPLWTVPLCGIYFLLTSLGAQNAHAQLTVNVPAGGDVQGASLQVLQAGGGTINLAAGNYYITGSIVLGANTTLNGAGGPGSATQSVIYAPATPNAISMVTQAYAGASNLTVSNLVLDGNIPQAAMLYGTGNDTAYANPPYNNNGIYIYSTSNTTVGVTLTNVEVRHTLRGILTGLVDNLTISGCYFHDNNPGGFSHNMYLVATSGVEIDHTRSNNALTGDGLHIDFGGQGYTIRKSEFSGNNGLGILSQQDNNVTVEDTKLDFNTNEGIQIDAGGLLLTRDETSYNGGYGLQIPSTADGAGLVDGFYSIGNDPLNTGGDYGPNYVYQAAQVDYTESNPGPNTYPSIQADGVLGVTDTADWTLNYGGYTYLGAVDFNANHLANGSITFQVGNAVATGTYPLNIRYANGTSGNQTMNLSINGRTAVPVTFAPTGSYSTWATITTNQTLNVGNNAVTLSVPTGATSAPELDVLTVTAATPPVPNAPTNVTAVANGPYSVTLTWTPPANSNSNAAQTYNVYKNNRVPIVAKQITGTTWTDTRIFYGETTNQYFVTAVNQGGESGASNTVTVSTGIDAPPGLQVTVKPSTPANTLNWLGVSGASFYLVKRSTVSGGPYQTIATVSASTNTQNPSYSDTALSNGQTYYYVVAAEDSNNNISANSYQVTAVSQTFSLAANTSSINLSTAATSAGTITVTGTNGFSDAVAFSLTGLPSGVTGVFSPTSATSGGSTQLTLTDSTSSPASLGSYPLTVTGKDGGLTSSLPLTLNVGQTQTITFNAIPAQAIGNSLTLTATASSGLPVTFIPVPNGNCSVSGSVVTFLNAGNCGINAYQTGNAIYGAAPSVGQIIVVNNPQSQTITFNAIAGQTAGGNITLTATASSGLPVSFASTTANVCTVSGNTASLLAGGTCSIVASQAGGGVYGPAASVTQSFTVATFSQTITFGPVPNQVTGTPYTPNATASSGLPIVYSVVQNGTCSVSGSTVTFLNVGACGVIASQPGNAVYAAATPVGQVITVNAGNPAIVFSIPDTHTLNSPITLSATSNSTGTFSYGVVSGPATVSGSTLTLTGGGSVTVTATQAASYNFNGGSKTATFTSIAGSVWLADAAGSLSTFDLTGFPLSPTTGFTGNGLTQPSGQQSMAFDATGNIWVANTGSTGISKFNKNGTPAAANPFTANISSPAALAVDGNSQVWVLNGNGSLTVMANTGAVTTTISDTTLTGANAFAIDQSGSLWTVNASNNSVREYLGIAAPTAPLATAVKNNTVGTKP
jgi:hypothetical protein